MCKFLKKLLCSKSDETELGVLRLEIQRLKYDNATLKKGIATALTDIKGLINGK